MESHHRRVSDNEGLDVTRPTDRSPGSLPSLRLMVFPSASSLNLNEARLRLPLEPRFRQSPRLCATLSPWLVLFDPRNSTITEELTFRDRLWFSKGILALARLLIDSRSMTNCHCTIQSTLCRISSASGAANTIRHDVRSLWGVAFRIKVARDFRDSNS